MAKYMTQPMSFGSVAKITYYRKQSAHPSHRESGQFTTDAKAAYAHHAGVSAALVEEGTYRSNQGVPADGEEI